METHTYIILLDRFLKGETTHEEEIILFNWIKRSNSRNELFEEYLNRWANSNETLSAEVQHRMFEKINKAINTESDDESTETQIPIKSNSINPFRKFKRISYGIAASIVLFLGLNIFLLDKSDSNDHKKFMVSADFGQKASLTLPDGTKVWLNSKTNLQYTTKYNHKDRILYLDGEAFFEVAKDKERPFIVKANGVDIVAVGTSFNVKSHLSEKSVSVTLLEGKVNVQNEQIKESLLPNDMIVYECEQQKYTKTIIPNSSHAALWRQGQLAFYNERLEDIAMALTRMYNVQINFNSVRLKDLKFSGVIKNSSLNNVLEILGASAPLRYSVKDDLITIEETL